MTIRHTKNQKIHTSMEKLRKQYNKNKNTYVQLEEGENHYLYGVWNLKDSPEGEPSYYEVFRKKFCKANVMPNGVEYPDREVYPNDNDFGSTAWCCNTMERVQFIRNEKCLF